MDAAAGSTVLPSKMLDRVKDVGILVVSSRQAFV